MKILLGIGVAAVVVIAGLMIFDRMEYQRLAAEREDLAKPLESACSFDRFQVNVLDLRQPLNGSRACAELEALRQRPLR